MKISLMLEVFLFFSFILTEIERLLKKNLKC